MIDSRVVQAGPASWGWWRARRTAVLAVAVALIVSACGSGGAGPGGEGAGTQQGGSVTLASGTEVATLDPVTVKSGNQGQDRALWIYDSLLRINAKGEVRGQLAEGMTTTDSKVWTLKLRPGVSFTDGTPLNADAVVFNIKRHQDPANKSGSAAQFADLTSVVATDSTTVTFTLAAPRGTFPLAFTQDVSGGLIASPAALANPATYARKPVGAGPFVVKEWVPDDHITFVRNPGYWQPGLPHLDEVTYRYIPDRQTSGQALLGGDLDIAYVDAQFPASQKGNPDITSYAFPGDSMSSLAFNFTRAPGNDPRVREAVALALNPKVINQVAYQGLWDEDTACLPFKTGSPYCEPGVATTFDLERAKKLIAEYAAGGGKTDITLLTYPGGVVETEYLQQAMQSIGLNVAVESKSFTEAIAQRAAGAFDVTWAGVSAFYDPYPKLYNYLISTGTNVPKAKIPELDAALDRARDATSAQGRVAAWKEVLRINAKEHVLIFYGPLGNFVSTRSTVDMGPDYDGSSVFFLGEVALKDPA